MALVKLQLGKKGLTSEFIKNLKRVLNNTENVRISLLKTSTRDKEKVREWAKEIIKNLGKKFTYKIIGYTIILKKWRKIPQ